MRIFVAIFISVLFAASYARAQEETFRYDDHGNRDPLWKLVGPNGTIINYNKEFLITDMVREAIMAESTGSNIAIINGTIVKVNDTIGMFVIKHSYIDKVILIHNNKEYILSLQKEE
jgi:hypothetical protein